MPVLPSIMNITDLNLGLRPRQHQHAGQDAEEPDDAAGEADIAQLAVIQKRMLKALWGVLRPGGRLLYCTCSLFSAEGDGQLQTFLTHNTDAVLLPSPGHLMPQNGTKADTVPDNGHRDHDGFYYALLQKRMA